MGMRLKHSLFWLILIVLIALPWVVVETYLEVLGLGNPLLYYVNPVYGYGLQPGQQEIRRRGTRVTIDSAGLRTPRDWSEAVDAKILFVGDSVTYGGSYIDDNETFAQGVCARLERRINRRMTCGNAGINGWGTDNMAGWMANKAFNDEAAVVVTLIAVDAVRGMTPIIAGPFRTEPTWFPVKALHEVASYGVWLMSTKLRQLRSSAGVSERTDQLLAAKKSLDNLIGVLRKIYGDGRKVLIVFSPAKRDLDGKETELVKTVRGVLERSGFEVLDLHEPVTKGFTDGFYYDDVHLDVAGHAFYADRIAERLEPYFAGTSAQ